MSDNSINQKAIELKNVAVHYRENKSLFKFDTYKALKDISFDIYKGETLGIIGRNGAGKSTLLRLLAGIIKPDKGEVIHHCKSVSLMALSAGFDPNLSGRQNVIISGMLIGHSKKEMLAKLDEIKDFSGLGDFFEKPVKTYSSGMRSRLGFSTAMHTHPDVLLIDEVLAVGDANFKEKAEKAITEKISSDITVILVSHSEQQMKRLCNRVILIESGIVRNSGKPVKVFNQYENINRFNKLGLSLYLEDKDKDKDKDKDYLIEFVEMKNKVNTLTFSVCIVSNNHIYSVGYSSENNDVVELNGPFSSPYIENKYPSFTMSTMSKYKDLDVEYKEKYTLFVNDEKLLDFIISES